MPPHTLTIFALGSISGLLALVLGCQLTQPRRSLFEYCIVAALACAEYVCWGLVYRLAFHPLAKYPGPLLAACTDWYTVYWIANGSRHLELHKQHEKHGKYVRYGPNRVSINSWAASRDLHDIKSNTFKSTAYGSFKRFFGAEMSLTTVDYKAHAFRRRVNVSALTPSAVRALESRVTPHVDFLVGRVDRSIKCDAADDGWGPSQNMAQHVAYCIADIMGDVTFSQHFNVQRDEKNRHFIHDLPKGVAGIHLVGHMQWLFLFDLHKFLFHDLLVGVGNLMALSRSFANKRVEDKHKAVAGGDIWEALLASRDPKTGRAFTKEELISEASLFIIGGTDGMITATTSTLFYLLHNPHTLDRLKCELRGEFPPTMSADIDSIPQCPIRFASPELQRITYLYACIDEAMRLNPPVPSILPRRVGPKGMILDGGFFPEGTDLGIPHYSLHRSEEYFAEPLLYKPERWMSIEEGGGSLRPGSGQAPSFTPFGAGRSSCIGKHMAYQEVGYILARLIWQFDIRMDPDNLIGEGTGVGPNGRERKDEFQLFDRFVSEQNGPAVQFRYR